MKKSLYILTYFIILFCLSCSKDANIVATEGNSIFYDDKELLTNMEKYISYVESLISEQKNIRRSIDTKANTNSIPLTKQQAAKLFLLMDFYSKTNGQWVPCFINRESNKIISINEDSVDRKVYEKLSKDQFYQLLINDNIDIKLIRNKTIIKNHVTKSSMSNLRVDNYDKVFEMQTASSSVLAGIATHHVIITWFKKVAYPGFTLENPYPEVDRCDSFISPVIGDYTEAGFSSAFTLSPSPNGNVNLGRIHGNCAGTIKITAKVSGFDIGTIHYIRTDFNFNTK